MKANESLPERHLLVAVAPDGSSDRAVLYVGGMLGGLRGFRVTLYHVVAEPASGFFASDEEKMTWVREHEAKGMEELARLSELLVQCGFDPEKVATCIDVRPCESIAQRIIEESERIGACTVVLSRRGISKKEEFLFGSTTNRLLHSPKNCSLWIVE